jgi:hypothetical protein
MGCREGNRMIDRVRRHLTYTNVVSTLGLFIVLGASAYAVTTLDRNSVLSKHIKNGQGAQQRLHDQDVGQRRHRRPVRLPRALQLAPREAKLR